MKDVVQRFPDRIASDIPRIQSLHYVLVFLVQIGHI